MQTNFSKCHPVVHAILRLLWERIIGGGEERLFNVQWSHTLRKSHLSRDLKDERKPAKQRASKRCLFLKRAQAKALRWQVVGRLGEGSVARDEGGGRGRVRAHSAGRALGRNWEHFSKYKRKQLTAFKLGVGECVTYYNKNVSTFAMWKMGCSRRRMDMGSQLEGNCLRREVTEAWRGATVE